MSLNVGAETISYLSSAILYLYKTYYNLSECTSMIHKYCCWNVAQISLLNMVEVEL